MPRRFVGTFEAMVVDTKDSEGLERVGTRRPWFDEDQVSDWVRVVRPYGCPCQQPERPQRGDEGLVSFIGADLRRPVVLGMLSR